MTSDLRRVLSLCVVSLLLHGCKAQRDTFNPVHDAAPPDVRALGLPTNDAGALVLIETSQVALVVDPTRKTPVHTMRGCRFWLRACREQNHDDLDLCVDNAPDCKNPRPWEVDEQCCPSACAQRYREHRAAGKLDGDALTAVYQELACFPGMATFGKVNTP